MTVDQQVLTNFTDEDNFYSCCTNFYESDIVKFLLGESFHPGGKEITLMLARTLNLKPGNTIIDIACGLSTSLMQIIPKFHVFGVGIDLSYKNLSIAISRVKTKGLDYNLSLIQADSHYLPFRTLTAASIMSECSFCIFLNKTKASNEIYRVLKVNGTYSFADVTKIKEWPSDLSEMFYRIACISEAQTIEKYSEILEQAEFSQIEIIDREDVIYDLHKSLKKKLLLFNIAWGINKIVKNPLKLSKTDFKKLNKTIDLIKEFVERKYGSYMIMSAQKIDSKID
ncbi:MAG: methyltransferase domain-containing protein [Candidatus Heimdallarchaeota archaeon]|nr:methyltransferase domain-containing protein [Candidatus Heimdallarchaeota archaeon]